MKPSGRFLKFLPLPDGCWEWKGHRDAWGYGQFKHKGTAAKAHRVSYELFVGPIPEGLVLMHKCDNPKCVRPDHLEPGTQEDNVRDRNSKGRTAMGADVQSSKLSQTMVQEIRERRSLGAERLASIYDVGVDAVKRVLANKTWKGV